MPKIGEKKRKLIALSHGTPVKPPKAWWTKMKKKTEKEYPKLEIKRISRIVGGIWAGADTSTKKKIVKKYQK